LLGFEARSAKYTPAVVDVISVRLLLTALAGWLNRQQNETITYQIAENRIGITKGSTTNSSTARTTCR
jgi:hypothetical protein